MRWVREGCDSPPGNLRPRDSLGPRARKACRARWSLCPLRCHRGGSSLVLSTDLPPGRRARAVACPCRQDTRGPAGLQHPGPDMGGQAKGHPLGPCTHLNQARRGVPPLLKVLLPVLLLDFQGEAGPQNALQVIRSDGAQKRGRLTPPARSSRLPRSDPHHPEARLGKRLEPGKGDVGVQEPACRPHHCVWAWRLSLPP